VVSLGRQSAQEQRARKPVVCLEGAYFFLAQSRAMLGASAFSTAVGACSHGSCHKVYIPKPVPSRPEQGWSDESRKPEL